jgi:hypothetical protein
MGGEGPTKKGSSKMSCPFRDDVEKLQFHDVLSGWAFLALTDFKTDAVTL